MIAVSDRCSRASCHVNPTQSGHLEVKEELIERELIDAVRLHPSSHSRYPSSISNLSTAAAVAPSTWRTCSTSCCVQHPASHWAVAHRAARRERPLLYTRSCCSPSRAATTTQQRKRKWSIKVSAPLGGHGPHCKAIYRKTPQTVMPAGSCELISHDCELFCEVLAPTCEKICSTECDRFCHNCRPSQDTCKVFPR